MTQNEPDLPTILAYSQLDEYEPIEDECHICNKRIGNEEYRRQTVLRTTETIDIGDLDTEDGVINAEVLQKHPAVTTDICYVHPDCFENHTGEAVRKEET